MIFLTLGQTLPGKSLLQDPLPGSGGQAAQVATEPPGTAENLGVQAARETPTAEHQHQGMESFRVKPQGPDL